MAVAVMVLPRSPLLEVAPIPALLNPLKGAESLLLAFGEVEKRGRWGPSFMLADLFISGWRKMGSRLTMPRSVAV